MASTTNWNIISLFLAPMDFLIPISLVLSVTVTIIMFITPIPPTIREMAATPLIKSVTVPVTSFIASSCAVVDSQVYFSLVSCISSSFATISSPKSSVLSGSSATKVMFVRVLLLNNLCAVEIGITISSGYSFSEASIEEELVSSTMPLTVYFNEPFQVLIVIF